VTPHPISSFSRHSQRRAPVGLDISVIHVTLVTRFDNLHAYYRELDADVFMPEGHTPSVDFAQQGFSVLDFHDQVDHIAGRFLSALRATLLPRDIVSFPDTG